MDDEDKKVYNEGQKYKWKNFKYKQLLLGIFCIVFVIYIIINYAYIMATYRVHEIVKRDNINNILFVEYAKNAAEMRVRGCTPITNVLFLSCSKKISNWAMGKYGQELDLYLKKMTSSNHNKNNLSNEQFWKSSYNLTNMDILRQRIENLLNENYRYEDLYKNTVPYFYDVRVVEDNSLYFVEFNVWKQNEKCKEEILSGIFNTVKFQLLKENEFRKNIKVSINLYSGLEGDDFVGNLYYDYVH